MTNDIKISREFSNIEEAVKATSFDISYNPAVAKEAMNMKPHSGMEVTNVFSDESNQIWYIIRLVGENLNLLHKWYPFSSCLSDSPFVVYHREGDRLAYVGRMNKTAINRRMISKVGLIAGCQN